MMNSKKTPEHGLCEIDSLDRFRQMQIGKKDFEGGLRQPDNRE
jgi:hypothetical protein